MVQEKTVIFVKGSRKNRDCRQTTTEKKRELHRSIFCCRIFFEKAFVYFDAKLTFSHHVATGDHESLGRCAQLDINPNGSVGTTSVGVLESQLEHLFTLLAVSFLRN